MQVDTVTASVKGTQAVGTLAVQARSHNEGNRRRIRQGTKGFPARN